jgi:hypothetical protein
MMAVYLMEVEFCVAFLREEIAVRIASAPCLELAVGITLNFVAEFNDHIGFLYIK